MEENQEFEGDLLNKATSFSELLYGDDDVGIGVDHRILRCSSDFSTYKTPKILCFDGDCFETNETPQKSVVTSCDSSSASCLNSLSMSHNKKRNGSVLDTVGGHKKTRAEKATSTGHAKKRKERLGERIAALQRLVSPFGKTDAASVLHEAMGYIRFLHDQVQVLCSPYLQGLPSSPHHHHHHIHRPQGDVEEKREAKKELRSRGLCLIPVECTINVANSNGADFWLPAMGNDN